MTSIAPRKSAFRLVSRRHSGFTLAELLVVIGIITVLIALLVPALAAARRQGQLVRCQSNLRQLAAGFYIYTVENKGRFPPNRAGGGGLGEYWYHDPYLGNILARDGISKAGVFSCPSDEESKRSYAMNIWVASAIDATMYGNPLAGALWGPAPRDSSRVILLVESWACRDSANLGYSALPAVGNRGDHPGRRFGAGAGITFNTQSRFGVVNSEVDYSRHRPRRSWARWTQPGGIVNIAYVDGHVADKAESDLADMSSGLSTMDTLWSRLDGQQNR